MVWPTHFLSCFRDKPTVNEVKQWLGLSYWATSLLPNGTLSITEQILLQTHPILDDIDTDELAPDNLIFFMTNSGGLIERFRWDQLIPFFNNPARRLPLTLAARKRLTTFDIASLQTCPTLGSVQKLLHHRLEMLFDPAKGKKVPLAHPGIFYKIVLPPDVIANGATTSNLPSDSLLPATTVCHAYFPADNKTHKFALTALIHSMRTNVLDAEKLKNKDDLVTLRRDRTTLPARLTVINPYSAPPLSTASSWLGKKVRSLAWNPQSASFDNRDGIITSIDPPIAPNEPTHLPISLTSRTFSVCYPSGRMDTIDWHEVTIRKQLDDPEPIADLPALHAACLPPPPPTTRSIRVQRSLHPDIRRIGWGVLFNPPPYHPPPTPSPGDAIAFINIHWHNTTALASIIRPLPPPPISNYRWQFNTPDSPLCFFFFFLIFLLV
jgi:hypothetical protein